VSNQLVRLLAVPVNGVVESVPLAVKLVASNGARLSAQSALLRNFALRFQESQSLLARRLIAQLPSGCAASVACHLMRLSGRRIDRAARFVAQQQRMSEHLASPLRFTLQ
jgi:hypothetical protein